MDFLEIARARQSCRSYDEARPVEQEKLDAVLEAARLAPSACNAQPYHFTVCRGQAAKAVVAGVTGMGMNKFAAQAPVLIVISERSYNKTAALGSRVTKVDYRSIDIGIAAAYLTAEAAAQANLLAQPNFIQRFKILFPRFLVEEIRTEDHLSLIHI